jgi:hypothetical protein
MRAVLDQHAHQAVPGRVEFKLVDALAAAVEIHQARRELVGEARELQYLAAAEAGAERLQHACRPAGAFALQALAQGGIAANRLTSPNGGAWLKTSWVSNRFMAASPCCTSASRREGKVS